MIEFVLDASAMVELATGRAPAPDLRRRAMTGNGAAPDLIDIETLHAVRGMHRRRLLSDTAADEAAATLAASPVVRAPHRALLSRIWTLRYTISTYDATYIALAEQLGVPLLTCDARLGRAHGHEAEVVVYPRS